MKARSGAGQRPGRSDQSGTRDGLIPTRAAGSFPALIREQLSCRSYDRELLTKRIVKKLRVSSCQIVLILAEKSAFRAFFDARKLLLHGISVAKYIVGQERRLVDPPSQVVAGVRTVTTQMDERCDAHVAALIRFLGSASRPPSLSKNKRWI